MERTILITSGHGLVCRNILRNQFFDILRTTKDLKIIIMSPASSDQLFLEEFSGKNVSFIDWTNDHAGYNRDKIFNILNGMLICNGTTKIKYELREGTERFLKFRYFLRKFVSFVAGKSRLIRHLLYHAEMFFCRIE